MLVVVVAVLVVMLVVLVLRKQKKQLHAVNTEERVLNNPVYAGTLSHSFRSTCTIQFLHTVVNFPCNVNVFECATSISLIPRPCPTFHFCSHVGEPGNEAKLP